jgi:16S rRNA processing protein RimM
VGWVELGRIGAPYGVKGWLHVDSYTAPPEGLLRYAEWAVRGKHGERQMRRVAEGRPHGERLVARLQGIEDRTAASLLTGCVIEVDRAALPPTRDREHYCADLVGCEVHNLTGARLGKVAHFVDTPGGPVMVVREQDGREHWVLAIPRHLRKVDLTAGTIQVDWPLEPL